MHEETFKGQSIYPVRVIGVMEVYQRQGWRSLGCPKYVVFHKNGKALEEFRRRRDAMRWATDNQNG